MPLTISPAEKRSASTNAKLLHAVKLLWINFSIFLSAVILLELFALAYYAIRKAIWDPRDPIADWVNRIPADAYADRAWLMAGFHEPDRLTARWEPFSYFLHREFSGKYLNIDGSGLRRTWNPPPAPQPIKVFTFGGSTMWGMGARDEYTIASWLSRMLANSYPSQVQVTNYGKLSYVNTQEMISLLRELQSGHRPEIAVFYDGYNDTIAAYTNHQAGVSWNEFRRYAEFNLLNPARTGDLYREVLRRSNLYTLFYGISAKLGRVKPRPKLTPEQRQQLINDVFKVYQANMHITEAVGDKEGFKSLFYWQPSPYTRADLNAFERSWLDDPEVNKMFSGMYTVVKRSPLMKEASFHDISDVFRGEVGTLYVDYAHTTERGNEIIARRIYQDVMPLVKEQIARRQSLGTLSGR